MLVLRMVALLTYASVGDVRLSLLGWASSRGAVSPGGGSGADRSVLPAHHQVLLSRGPYHYDGEHALLREHRIDALVTKNSGGAMTRPKLDAAATLGVAVVMIDRPPLPAGVVAVRTVAEAAAWVSGP